MSTFYIHILVLMAACGAPLHIVEKAVPDGGFVAQGGLFFLLMMPIDAVAAAWVGERTENDGPRPWLRLVTGTGGALFFLGMTWKVVWDLSIVIRSTEWALLGPAAAFGVLWSLDLLRLFGRRSAPAGAAAETGAAEPAEAESLDPSSIDPSSIDPGSFEPNSFEYGAPPTSEDSLPLDGPARAWSGAGLLILAAALYAHREPIWVGWVPLGLFVGSVLVGMGVRAWTQQADALDASGSPKSGTLAP